MLVMYNIEYYNDFRYYLGNSRVTFLKLHERSPDESQS